jgi:hypothetical protein
LINCAHPRHFARELQSDWPPSEADGARAERWYVLPDSWAPMLLSEEPNGDHNE